MSAKKASSPKNQHNHEHHVTGIFVAHMGLVVTFRPSMNVAVVIMCTIRTNHAGQGRSLSKYVRKKLIGSISTWVVVKIMVPFWVPIIIRHLLFRVPKKGP